MIIRKSPEDVAIMRRGAAILADAFAAMEEALRPGVSTAELDRVAEKTILGAGAVPSFKGYRGFPASICASPNEVVVHGIPSDEVVLEEGDIISLDVGVFFQGFHVDSAWTFPVGDVDPETAKLLETTEAALLAGVQVCRVGNRLGDVGHAIEQAAAPAGISVVRDYVGHGVGRALHEDPQVPNYGPPGRRETISSGMTLAIEPMMSLGDAATTSLDDGWTVVTRDGSRSAHFEHTVAVTAEGTEVLTARGPR